MKRRILMAVTAVLIAMFLCSCGMSDKSFEKKGNNVVVILNDHANAFRYTEQTVERDIKSLLMDAITYEIIGSEYVATLNVSIIIPDGKPVREKITYTFQEDIRELEMTETATYAEKAVREGEDLVDKVIDFILSSFTGQVS